MQTHIIETVFFKLAPGVTADTFLASNEALDSFLDEAPGFLTRRLSLGEDGTWLDYVEWRDMDSAKEAAAAFKTAPGLAAFAACIDGASVQMTHRTLAMARG